MSDVVLDYIVRDPLELNLSYMPFIENGGLFIPSNHTFSLGDRVIINLLLPGLKDSLIIEGKVVWITPPNALHHVLPGVGVQFTGQNAQVIRGQVESHLDNKMDIGGYTYGITEREKKG